MAEQKEDQLQNAAINLVSMLRAALNNTAVPNAQGQSTTQPRSDSGRRQDTLQEAQRPNAVCSPAQRPSETAVQQNMSRCFPGLFKDRKKGRPLSQLLKKRPRTKTTPVQFFFLHSPAEKTPKPPDELMLLQAGLGRRTVNVPEDAGHKELTEILCETYPKLSELEGAWMLHKAMGGSGQRRLTLLSPQEEGYTGASLVKSWGGKGCLYIMPIQITLDISPLPLTAQEFVSMPKARCVSCQEFVPLQLLSIHVTSCSQSKVSEETHTDDDLVILDDDCDNDIGSSSDIQSFVLDNQVACPMCSELFTKEDISIHASFCGESDEVAYEEQKLEDPEAINEQCVSLSEILKILAGKVDTSKTFYISVTRQDLFQRGLKQWARQKQASPINQLRVSFIGEYGIDEGALRKEFLTEMMRGIQTHFFEGEGQQGKNPKYSICDYQDNNFKICGEIFATSLVQGGPAPNFITEWCYHFLCHGEIKQDVSASDVTDLEMKSLILEVKNANEERMMELSDPIVSCGYTGPIHVDKKMAVINAITLHSLVRLTPMLSQLREGLKVYGLDEVLSQHPQITQPLFVPGHLKEVDADFIVLALSPEFSEEGSVRRQREMKVINFLQDFIQKLEDEDEAVTQEEMTLEGAVDDGSVSRRMPVQSFLQWATGQAHVPFIESERNSFKINIYFEHDCTSRYGIHSICYPIVNACAVAITFPTRHMATYQEFEKNLTEAIQCGCDFSRH